MKKQLHLVITAFLSLSASFCLSCSPNAKDLKPSTDPIMQAYMADSTFFAGEDTVEGYTLNTGIRQPLRMSPKWANDTLIQRMIDLYNTFEIQHSLEVDIDAFQRFETEDSEFPQLFTNIDFSAILNDTLRSYLQKSFALDAKYWALKPYQREEYAEQIDQEKRTLMQKVNEILTPTISLLIGNNDSLTIDRIQKSISPTNWLPNVYTDYVGQDAEPDSAEIAELYNNMLNERNFDKRAATQFALCANWHLLDSRQTANLFSEIELMMQSGIYSRMLPLLWRAYRVAYNNLHSCPSTYCYSPNIRYNHYRRLVAHTILQHIHQNPNDETAKVQFYFHTEQDDILRAGQYPFGNESATEGIYIFWQKIVF